ncbi:MAG TPA: DUF3634 family protein [Polyangiaceae bacterium]|nr:DUF3634 family protein [Polyangiaceae bacterium]
MSLTVGLVIMLLLALPLAWAIARSNELFVLRARKGKLDLVRGRLPQALFRELADVAERQRLDDLEVRAVVEGGVPRLLVRGQISEAAEQQLRNVLGRFKLTQIRTGKLRA